MMNKPGISWGRDKPINALRTSRGWLLIDFTEDRPCIIGIVPKSMGILARSTVYQLGALLNYNSYGVSPQLAAELDTVA